MDFNNAKTAVIFFYSFIVVGFCLVLLYIYYEHCLFNIMCNFLELFPCFSSSKEPQNISNQILSTIDEQLNIDSILSTREEQPKRECV
jgi:hypothetical protein